MAIVTLSWTISGSTDAAQAGFDPGDRLTRFGQVELDASISESHVQTADVTDHPVEQGPNITDYIRPMPRKLTLDCMVTNTPVATQPDNVDGATMVKAQTAMSLGIQHNQYNPVNLITGAISNWAAYQGSINWNSLQASSEFDRVRSVYAGLLDAIRARALFDIATSLTPLGNKVTAYQNFACTSFTVPRSAGTGTNVLHFTLEFQEILIATTQTVAIPLIAKTKKAHQSPTTADPKQPGPLKAILASTYDDAKPDVQRGNTVFDVAKNRTLGTPLPFPAPAPPAP